MERRVPKPGSNPAPVSVSPPTTRHMWGYNLGIPVSSPSEKVCWAK